MRYHLHRMPSLIVFATILLLSMATFALAAEQDWQVVVYEHDNYRGKSLVYSVQLGMCQKLEPELKKAKMNDKVTSVKVGKHVYVLLFEHTNYSGEFFHLQDSTPSLVPLKFNDKVSSLIVYPKAMGDPLGVVLKGSKQSLYPTTETCGGVSYPRLVYNDNAVRILMTRAGRGYCGQIRSTIYEHTDFKGKSQTCTAGPYGGCDIGQDLREKASSLKIEIVGDKCPVRTQ